MIRKKISFSTLWYLILFKHITTLVCSSLELVGYSGLFLGLSWGRNKASFPMQDYRFVSQFKGFFPNYICSALKIATENKIFTIK